MIDRHGDHPAAATRVWEVRGFTGKDVAGKSTQVSRTVYGTKKDARLVAAELTVKPARNARGR